VRALLIASLIVAALVPLPAIAQAPPGEIGIRLLDAPIEAKNDPRARIYIVDHVAPGATISRRIEVSSGLNRSTSVALYAAGADVANGTFRFFDGHRQNELSGWTTVAPSSVVVPAKGARVGTVTIAVPSDAAEGERYAVAWAEIASRGAGGVRSVNRVGIRIYLSVGSGGAPKADFVVDTLTASRTASGQPQVSALVRNTGGRALDMSGTLRLTNGPGGLSAGPFAVKLGTTLGVGQEEPVTVLLDPALPNGPWDARLILRSGELAREATGRITFPSGAGTTSPPVPAKTRSLDTPVGRLFAAGSLLFILLAGGFLLFFLKRRRRTEDDQRSR
jgi:hypothetical protein